MSLRDGRLESQEDDVNKKYQWLPSEFTVDTNKKVKIGSYINNLDEIAHKDLYDSIGQIFEQFIPHFENLLGTNLTGNCQVITKMSNIIVNKNSQKYDGGVWHLEGTSYENIIATGIYYYDVENIKNSNLEFRKAISHPINYPQNDDYYVEKKYNINDGDELNRYLGKISTSVKGRCIVFPNYIQHKVSQFELNNKNKDGTRKILVFFLVDPNKKITSTANVPIQQRHIIKHRLNLMKLNMPDELIECVLDYMGLMTDDEAQQHMLGLMSARKYYIDHINEELFEREFSLCEH